MNSPSYVDFAELAEDHRAEVRQRDLESLPIGRVHDAAAPAGHGRRRATSYLVFDLVFALFANNPWASFAGAQVGEPLPRQSGHPLPLLRHLHKSLGTDHG
jgi:hypothetical protein